MMLYGISFAISSLAKEPTQTTVDVGAIAWAGTGGTEGQPAYALSNNSASAYTMWESEL
jgi:hypothetical protein